jgi:hypothetical protein
MDRSEFVIGETFWWGRLPWRCTDIGTRVVMAIRLDIYPDSSWFNGPPYKVGEIVFDESAIKECTADPPLDEHGGPPKPRIGQIRTVVVEGANAEQMRKNMAKAIECGKEFVWEPPGLRHSEFEIGGIFACGGFRLWRCTDIGSRAITAIALDDLLFEGSRSDLDDGRPHSPECVFDEYDVQDCALAVQIDDDVLDWLRKKGISSVKAFHSKLKAILQEAMLRDP